MQAQPPQSALNQAVLDRLSQIEQQLQKGLVSPSSSGNQVEMPEVLQAMQVCRSCCRPARMAYLPTSCWRFKCLHDPLSTGNTITLQ